jgi:hypothetical protein
MDTQAYDSGYDLVYGLLDIFWQHWDIIGPVVLIPMTLGFVLWVWRRGRGESVAEEDLDGL